MTVEELQPRLKNVTGVVYASESGKYGDAKIEFIPTKHGQSDNGFSDVRTVKLEFLDKRLTRIEISYNSEFKWENVDEFVEKITSSLKLPDAWHDALNYPGVESYRRVLNCEGFDVEAEVLGTASLSISNSATKEIIEQRRKRAEDSKKDSFKP